MAINKNFVVKNGLEVNSNLLIVDAVRDKVGIGSTAPRTELDVRGGIAATDIYLSGVGTIATLQATDATIQNLTATNLSLVGPGFTAGVGTLTALRATHITASGVTTAATLDVTGTARIITGIITSFIGDNVKVNGNVNVTGISTFNSISIGSTQIVNNERQLQNIASLDAVTTATIEAAVSNAPNTFSDLKITGFSTFNAISAGNVTLSGITTGLNVPGISTLSSIQNTNLSVTGFSTFNAVSVGNLSFAGIATGLNVPGISTLGSISATNISSSGVTTAISFRATNSNISGVTTLGTVQVSSGIITATSGIVTYYGDGSKLTGVGPTIHKLGTFVGAGATLLDFRGSGIATVTVDSGIATIFVEGGGGGATLQTQILKEVVGITTAGIVSFTLTNGYSAGYVDVFVNGAKLSSSDFTETLPNIITLNSGTSIGDNVEFVNYQTVSTGFTTAVFATQAYGILNSPNILVGIVTASDIIARNINASGILTASNIFTAGIVTALDFNATSDRNLKTNIEIINDPLEKIVQINGVSFNWKETNQSSAGVIAQEVEQIMPEIIHDNEKGYKTLNYNGLIGLLIESVKELKCEIEDLKSKLNLNI